VVALCFIPQLAPKQTQAKHHRHHISVVSHPFPPILPYPAQTQAKHHRHHICSVPPFPPNPTIPCSLPCLSPHIPDLETSHILPKKMSATHTTLTAAAQQMNRLQKNRYGAQYIYTALEVLFFAKGAKSLHFGECPAKVHWSGVPDPVSNPCCRQVADVNGKNYALVDLLPIRSKGLSGDISFKGLTQKLLIDDEYVQALKVYFKCSIEYFSAATVFPVWGQANAKLVSKLDIGADLLPIPPTSQRCDTTFKQSSPTSSVHTIFKATYRSSPQLKQFGLQRT
jgi:hypothetical protein